MALWPWTKRKKVRAVGQVMLVRGRFDAAQTTPDNRKHWANADPLSPDAASSPSVRRTLRNRARYEVANNCYARNLVLALANYVIGTGPRLQMLTESDEINRIVEAQFAAWAQAVDLPGKLRTMRQARAQDGEAFAIMFDNPRLVSPVTLDIRLIEADQVTTPDPLLTRVGAVDGIVFDQFGNPVAYDVLKQHPGSNGVLAVNDYDRISASNVLHWFRADRPGQSRGLPDILPALPLFAQLRRYTLAVLAAAETAANIAIVMKTNTPAGGEAAEVEPMTEMEFTPNMGVFSPEGWEPIQIKAEQPATTYEMFIRRILNEIGCCVGVPYAILACDASDHNFASGRLDHQGFYRSVMIDRADLELRVLDRILGAWLAEATRVFRWGDLVDVSHQWFWDGFEHVDPAKEANAQATRLTNHTTTLAAEYAKAGLDWESELRQRAREIALMDTLGLTVEQSQPVAPTGEGDNEQRQHRQAA